MKSDTGVVDTHVVTVAVPNQVGLYAQGLLLTGASDSEAQVSQASIVEGGEATFLVRYFLDGTELYGSGALSSTATGALTSMNTTSSMATARDFLQVSVPPEGMSGSVSLLIDKMSVADVDVDAVPGTQVSQVTILFSRRTASEPRRAPRSHSTLMPSMRAQGRSSEPRSTGRPTVRRSRAWASVGRRTYSSIRSIPPRRRRSQRATIASPRRTWCTESGHR